MLIEAPGNVELSSYAPVRIAEHPAHVTDEMIDAQINRELERFARYVDAPDAAAEGDFLYVDMTTTVNGKAEASLSGNGLTIALGKGMEPEGFVENVTGMNVGESRSFDFVAYDRTGYANGPDMFHVDIRLIAKHRRTVPKLTDEFVASRLSQHDSTVEQFRNRVRAFLLDKQKSHNEMRLEQDAVSELSTRLITPIDDSSIEEMRDALLDTLTREIAMQGSTLSRFMEQQGLSERQFQMTLLVQARESIRQGFALDALARHLGVTVDEGARRQAVGELAQENADEMWRRCEAENAWEAVDTMARRNAAVAWLMKTAIIERKR